ncbi:MAG: 2-dehydro-3-deoxygalactonokinase [Pseudomonadota bacterium]
MLIGVDWGTTNLRAHLIGADGGIEETVRSDAGLMKVPAGGFETTLATTIAPLRDKAPDAPVIMSGMVGARGGWVEAPYVPTPANLDAIADKTLTIDAPTVGTVWLVPGVAVGIDGAEWADVMRGEETEILGALDAMGGMDGTYVLPGTHAKWISVKAGAITGFRTFMTGDLFSAIHNHTILSRSKDDTLDPAAFEDGLEMARGLTAPGDLLTRLFTIRAEGLMGRCPQNATLGTLSGLLVGAEVLASAREADEVIIVGASPLAMDYTRACNFFGVHPRVLREEMAPRGQALIAARRGAMR